MGSDNGSTEAFVGAIEAAHARLRSISEQALSALGNGITLTQLRLLNRLELLGESRLIDLADALAIAPSTATRLCDSLADRRLIVRQRRGHDRRELQIRLTETGAHLLRSVHERISEGWQRALDQFSPDELRLLVMLLARMEGTAPVELDRADRRAPMAAADLPA